MAKKKKQNTDVPVLNAEEKAAKIFAEMLIERMEGMKLDYKTPWVKTENMGYPRNYDGRNYNGFNAFLLMMLQGKKGYNLPVYMTFHKAKELEAPIKKGETGMPVCFWSMQAYLDKEKAKQDGMNLKPKLTGAEYDNLTDAEKEYYKIRPFVTTHIVFNIQQTRFEEVHPEKYQELLNEYSNGAVLHDTEGMFRSVELDHMLKNQTWLCPVNVKQGDKAFYSPLSDSITVPKKEQFVSGEEFYGTLLHEMAHSTGIEGRLGRKMGGSFGSDEYAREELVAEMTSAIVAAQMGFGKAVEDNNVAYLQGWTKRLREEPKFILTLMSDINKASAMIQQHVFTEKMANEVKNEAIESIHDYMEKSDEQKQQQKNEAPRMSREELKNLTGSIRKNTEEQQLPVLEEHLYETLMKYQDKVKDRVMIIRCNEGRDYAILGENVAQVQSVLPFDVIKTKAPDGTVIDKLEFSLNQLDYVLPKLIRSGFFCAIVDNINVTRQQQKDNKEQKNNINPKNESDMAKKKSEEAKVQNSDVQAQNNEVKNTESAEKKQKNGIDVYKTSPEHGGVYVVQEFKDGEKVTPARKIEKNDLEEYFAVTNPKEGKATKEQVQEARQKLWDKYLSPQAEAKRAELVAQLKNKTVELVKPAEEVAARLSKVRVFEGKNGDTMIGATIDEKESVYKSLDFAERTAFFKDSKNPEVQISKEEWADRRVALAAIVFADKLAPKVEQEQSQGMKR